MELAPKTRLGPYEILVSLGAGGMGEVYKARDTRLDRDVAIKILPAGLAQNAQFKLRFEREARAISQLNHPNICTLHDVGEENGISFLVMELVDGESLAELLTRGPLPSPDVLRYGTQIAEALSKAHRAGIIHRDLKPGNIMITRAGAKLLDFGLAKSNVLAVSVDEATQHKALTQEGTIVGTFQYMSPEQLEGQEADARTDIFALGAVLYEMATGHRAFDGKTKTSLIAAIVKEQPRPIAELQPLTPPALQHVVDKCLAKDPDDRWQSALDVASELKWISSAGSQAGVAAPLASARNRRKRLVVAAAIAGWAIAIAAIVTTAMTWSRLRAASRVTRTDLAASIAPVYDAPLAVSPDGRRIAMEVPGKTSQLAIRDLSDGSVKLLPGTEGATFPFWAPDGHALGFFAAGRLKTIDTETGAIQLICEAPYGRGGSWSRLGFIIFAPNIATPIMKVSENGGTPVAVTRPANEQSDRNPVFLPDGKHFLHCRVPLNQIFLTTSTVRAGSLDGGLDRKVLDYASSAAFVNGWLLTVRDRNLMAQRFDAGDLEVRGKPVAIAQNIDFYLGRFLGTFSAAGETLVYQQAPAPKRQLLAFNPSDARPVAVGDPAFLANPAVSPDGRRVIVNRLDQGTTGADAWMIDLAGGPSVRLTFTARGTMDDYTALFSPDGQRVALSEADEGGSTRARIQPVGGGTQERLQADSDKDFAYLQDWSRDGKSILISPQRPKTGQDIEVIHLDGDRKAVPLIHGPSDEINARFSPNGKWMAYQSDESGRTQIYVTTYPSATSKWQVSTEGGTRPFWSADGRQLYYLAGDRVVAAAIHDGDSFSADAALPVEALGDHIQDFAVALNGRIVALREIDRGQPPLTVVMNWAQPLNQK